MGNSKSGEIRMEETQPQSEVFIAVCESKNPGNPKSRRFKIGEVDFPGNLKSRKLKIWETKNTGKPKFGESNGKLKIWETQKPGAENL